jgi:hypothetical protein
LTCLCQCPHARIFSEHSILIISKMKDINLPPSSNQRACICIMKGPGACGFYVVSILEAILQTYAQQLLRLALQTERTTTGRTESHDSLKSSRQPSRQNGNRPDRRRSAVQNAATVQTESQDSLKGAVQAHSNGRIEASSAH